MVLKFCMDLNCGWKNNKCNKKSMKEKKPMPRIGLKNIQANGYFQIY
jgi:hypothetical protein